jgi:hypothetical protein
MVLVAAPGCIGSPQLTTIQLKKPFLSHSLSGTALDYDGGVIPGVEVYRCDRRWENCIQFATTDKQGHFAAHGPKLGKYHLRLDGFHAGFDPLEVVVVVNPVFVKSLRLRMHVGQ